MKASLVLNKNKSLKMYFKYIFQMIIIIYIYLLEEILVFTNIITLKSSNTSRFINLYLS